MSIQITQLVKTYGTQVALNGISLSVQKGSILGFLGPNGAGKSTTMKLITGFLKPDAGSIEVCGQSVATNPGFTKRCIGYLPENNPLYNDMYVKEYLHFTAGMYGLTSTNVGARVAEMIAVTGLTKEQNKRAGQLSRGYRQRLGLAAALIHDPEVLILDEPTSGLDPNQIIEIRSLIQELGKHKTVIFSTHIMSEVEQICNRVIIINAGNLVADNTVEAITVHQAKEQYEIRVVSEQPIESDLLQTLHPEASVSVINANEVVITAPVDTRQAIFKLFADKGWPLLELKLEKKTLESQFRALTQP